MDTQTLILLVMMAAGIIYVTVGYLYRKITAGESFTPEKMVMTFGYIALMAVAAYITTGAIPNFDLLLTQAMAGLPDPATTMTLIMTVVTWIVHNVIKKAPTAQSDLISVVGTLDRSAFPSTPTLPGSTVQLVGMPVGPAKLPANWIARPVGIFKAGPNGAGGDFEELGTDPTKTAIRHDMFARTDIIYGLDINRDAPAALKMESIIIDVEYDGYTEHDPHLSRPTEFLTDYPAGLGSKGLMFGYFKAPNNRYEYSANKVHSVKIMSAPRPMANPDSTPGARDFSEAAGGVTAEFKFLIYPTSQPLILSPMQQDQ